MCFPPSSRDSVREYFKRLYPIFWNDSIIQTDFRGEVDCKNVSKKQITPMGCCKPDLRVRDRYARDGKSKMKKLGEKRCLAGGCCLCSRDSSRKQMEKVKAEVRAGAKLMMHQMHQGDVMKYRSSSKRAATVHPEVTPDPAEDWILVSEESVAKTFDLGVEVRVAETFANPPEAAGNIINYYYVFFTVFTFLRIASSCFES